MNIKLKSNSIRQSIEITLLIILMLFISNIISGVIGSKFEIKEGILILLKLILYIFSYLIVMRIFKIKISDFLNKKVSYKYIVVIGISIGLMLIVNVILDVATPSKIQALPTLYEYLQKIFNIVPRITTPYGLIYLISLTVFIAPVLEEIVFRGYILNLLCSNNSRSTKVISSIVVSFLFGFMHLGVQAGINAFIYSLIASYVMLKYKDIKLNIGIHSLLNIITLLMIIK